MASGRGRASGGRARSRRDEELEEDERPRGGYQRGPKGPNLPLIIGSVVGLIALLAIGGVMMSNTSKNRAADARRKRDDEARAKRAHEDKLAAMDAEAKRRETEKLARTGPWAKALEKVVMPLKRFTEKEKMVQRFFGARGWENDRAEFHITVRAKWLSEPMDDVREWTDNFCNKIVECAEAGIAHAEKEGYPLKDENKQIIIHFWEPRADEPEAPEGAGNESDPFDEAANTAKKKKDRGRELATYKNGSLTITGRR